MPSLLLRQWRFALSFPTGRQVFNRALGEIVPYARTIRPDVITVEPGFAVIELDERRRLRNNVGSVHAAALVNLGELAANFAMASLETANARSIIVGLDVRYLRKGRGRLTATARVEDVDFTFDHESRGTVEITDAAKTLVCEIVPTWKVGPRPDSTKANTATPSSLAGKLEHFLSRWVRT